MDDLTVGRSVQCIVENGGSDPDAVWHHRSDRSNDEAGSVVWGSVYGNGVLLGANLGRATVTNGDLLSQRVALFPNYFGQTHFDK